MEKIPTAPKILSAESFLNKERYAEVHHDSRPLVASIDHIVEASHMDNPAILEIGVVPTFHYFGENGGYNPDALPQSKSMLASNVPPSYFLKKLHPLWHVVGLSPHDIPEAEKKKLFPGQEDIFAFDGGPERHNGLNFDDVWDTGYQRGEGIARQYPYLIEKLGGKQPDIIFGRHVFDAEVQKYPSGKLLAVSAMLLNKGGFLVSQIYGSHARRSYMPLDSLFPFDMARNLKQYETIEFKGWHDRKDRADCVFIFQKVDDAVRPGYAEALKT